MAVDITNQKLGNWTAIARTPRRGPQRHTLWMCRCDCGVEREMTTGSLRLAQRTNQTTCQKCRKPALTHGYTPRGRRNATYTAWANMLARCSDPNRPEAHNYIGRGITVCARWRNFENFLADMGERPAADLTLDRIDNAGNYEPGNCRWVPRAVQCRNMRRTKLTEETAALLRQTPGKLRDLAETFGISKSLVHLVKTGQNWKPL